MVQPYAEEITKVNAIMSKKYLHSCSPLHIYSSHGRERSQGCVCAAGYHSIIENHVQESREHYMLNEKTTAKAKLCNAVHMWNLKRQN